MKGGGEVGTGEEGRGTGQGEEERSSGWSMRQGRGGE